MGNDVPPDTDGRDATADDRDRTADAQDKVSEDRDQRAEARDLRAAAREELNDRPDAAAAADRAGAKRDRQGGAGDRLHAEKDREAASTDRAFSARERSRYIVDGLTGAHRREAGVMELEREVTRAKRTKQPFVLAFVDVDGLKTINDSLGHDAGDRLLQQVVETIRGHVRPYDLIVRYGGDEFLCGVLDLTLADTAERFARVNADLAANCRGSVSTGLAELTASDRLEDLVKRADAAMYGRRQRRAVITLDDAGAEAN